VGIQDRDYMRERGRRAQSGRSSAQWGASAFSHSWGLGRLGDLGTLSRVLIVGIVIMLVFLAVKHLLAHRDARPLPTTGDVHWYLSNAQPRIAKLTLRARESSSSRYFAVVLDDWASGAPVAMIPVRSGETSVTLMPLGRYRMTIAKGSTWMGPDRRFGISGDSKVVVHPMEFYQRGNQVFGHAIDLEVPFVGNLETTPAGAQGRGYGGQ
jgi:hypothetical protein